MDDLRSVIAEMRTVASQGTLSFKLAGWADRLEAAQSLQAPEGWVLVPVVPTAKMCDDAVHAAVHGSHGSPWFPHAWRAALKAAAAPAPIEQEG